MKNLKEQKPDVEAVKTEDVELSEEQLEIVAGGTCNLPLIAFHLPTNMGGDRASN